MKIRDYSLYLIISEEYCMGRSAIDIAKSAIKGGVDVIQMREKNKSVMELVALGEKLAILCKNSRVTFIVNDDPMLAKEIDADGVHLGQEDIKLYSLEMARRLLGSKKIIGVSTHTTEQFKEANEKDFDYIAFGPVFATKAKDYHIGTTYMGNILDIAKRKVFFIGGIDLVNIDEVLREGGRNIALIRAITEADDIISTVKKFKNKMKAKEGKNEVR
jgi:thiamine-phosphate pyrophosphorylase